MSKKKCNECKEPIQETTECGESIADNYNCAIYEEKSKENFIQRWIHRIKDKKWLKEYNKKQEKRKEEALQKEFERCCKHENPDWDGKSFDYGIACYKSAFGAYKVAMESLSKDEHSGFSWSMTISLLKRLLDGKPLTAITEEDFYIDDSMPQASTEELEEKGLISDIQCPRHTSLFQYKYKDGRVEYHDVDRGYNIDEVNNCSYGNGLAEMICEEKGLIPPITMPYWIPDKKYVFYTIDVYYDDVYDELMGKQFRYIDYFITPKGEKVKVDALYCWVQTGKSEWDGEYQEITDVEEKKIVVKILKSQIKRYQKEKEKENASKN